MPFSMTSRSRLRFCNEADSRASARPACVIGRLGRSLRLRHGDHRIDQRHLGDLDLAAKQRPECQAEFELLRRRDLGSFAGRSLRHADILSHEIERGEHRKVHRPVHPEPIAGRGLDLREQSVAHVVGGDEQGTDEGDGRADDGDDREADKREAHLTLRTQN